MTTILMSLLIAAQPAGGHVEKNPLFAELLKEGVPVAEGQKAPVPEPVMPDGLDAAGFAHAPGRAPLAVRRQYGGRPRPRYRPEGLRAHRHRFASAGPGAGQFPEPCRRRLSLDCPQDPQRR